MNRRLLPIVTLLLSRLLLGSATAFASTPHCPQDAPISFEVYQNQKSYVAIIIVDGGAGYVGTITNPHIGIGLSGFPSIMDIACKDYGNANQTVAHVIACTYPASMTGFLTRAVFTPVFENGDSCTTQKFGVPSKSVLFTDATATVAQCISSSIINVNGCTSMVRDAVLGKPLGER